MGRACLNRYFGMAEKDSTVEELKTLFEAPTKIFEERLSRIEGSYESTGRQAGIRQWEPTRMSRWYWGREAARVYLQS